MNLARTIGVASVLWGIFMIGVPWLVLTSTRDLSWLWLPLGSTRWIGLLAIAFGVYLYVWSVAHLLRRQTSAIPGGRPTALETGGWYARVRHPLLLGVVAILIGEAVTTRSLALLGYALAYWLWLHVFVTWREEPQLRATFGEAYSRYAARVPRWIPRSGPPASHGAGGETIADRGQGQEDNT